MSEDKNSKDIDQNKSNVDLSRRRFSKAGIIATPIIASVVGRPAWGGQCSPSAVLSHTHASHHPEVVNCELGCSPGYWRNCDHNWSDITEYHKDNDFCTEFFGSATDGACPFPGKSLHDVVDQYNLDVGYSAVAAHFATTYPHIREFKKWRRIKRAFFHAVAALLNASANRADGGYLGNSPEQIINAFYTEYRAFYEGRDPYCQGLKDLKNVVDQYDVGDDSAICLFDHFGDISADNYWDNRIADYKGP